MNDTKPTLCLPDPEKSCFACCPPIRPQGYEHIQFKNIIKRMLRENTRAFTKGGKGVTPITGFSCWALGYVDRRYKLVGCLIHPAQNGGMDLRYLIDYGQKCRRETCPEAKVFNALDIDDRKFWLHLADGFDAFSYSSKKINPLFKMLGWGKDILSLIALNRRGEILRRESFFQDYPFFSTRLNPKANAYLVNRLIKKENDLELLKRKSFLSRFESFSARLSGWLRSRSFCSPEVAYTHKLHLDTYFLDFLRLSGPVSRIDEKRALRLRRIVDQAIWGFQKKAGFWK